MLDLIAPYIPPWSLRSSNKNLLIVPDIRSETGRRSFSFAAPKIWNSLPQHIRFSDSLSLFRGLLKTFLYQKSLPPVINSLHNVSSDFDLCTYNGHSSLPCISHRFISPNNLIVWKGCPRCLYLKTKRALSSLLLLSLRSSNNYHNRSSISAIGLV